MYEMQPFLMLCENVDTFVKLLNFSNLKDTLSDPF